MKMYKEMTWQHETTGPDGNVQLFGVNLFDYPWKDTGEKIEVKSPRRENAACACLSDGDKR